MKTRNSLSKSRERRLLNYWRQEKQNAFFYKDYRRMKICDKKISYYSSLRS